MIVNESKTEEGFVLTVEGVMKKADGMQLADKIIEAGHAKPGKLILDFTNLAAVAFDSVPFVVSAIERARLGKENALIRGANNVVERTFRGSGFERVGKFE